MAINLANKYAKELAQAFNQKSVVDGVACKDYEFTGVKNLKVYTAVSQDLTIINAAALTAMANPKRHRIPCRIWWLKKTVLFPLPLIKAIIPNRWE